MSLVNIIDGIISPKSITFDTGLTTTTYPGTVGQSVPIIVDVSTAAPISSGTPYTLYTTAGLVATHSYFIMISISVQCTVPSGQDGAVGMNINYFTGAAFDIAIPEKAYVWKVDGANILVDGVNTSFILTPNDVTDGSLGIYIDFLNVGGTYTIPDALGIQTVTVIDLGERNLSTESGFPSVAFQPAVSQQSFWNGAFIPSTNPAIYQGV
jgi:hypothetical protein|tara:strand:- start:2544 stop:3173 length:630 start_codon:yes stop_codon:yes gene_type:complete